MRVKHTLTIDAVCPFDDNRDTYKCVITSARFISVEEIQTAVENLTRKAFQEDITEGLARTLGATVRTVGWHSGVKTEVVA
jgi:hypothetical protein